MSSRDLPPPRCVPSTPRQEILPGRTHDQLRAQRVLHEALPWLLGQAAWRRDGTLGWQAWRCGAVHRTPAERPTASGEGDDPHRPSLQRGIPMLEGRGPCTYERISAARL